MPPQDAAMTNDERILAILARDRVSSSAALAAELDWQDRAIRRRLRRLIKDGYVFSPVRGRYRLTAAGRAVLEDPPTAAEEPARLSPWDMTTRDVIDRWRRGR
ncbi:MAG: winged helix-turn-helix transcriptional regulator [Chloroflexota bacterium]|nr:winged helix-turn-helix transcriptional regulator [Chloroflexota bacterium]